MVDDVDYNHHNNDEIAITAMKCLSLTPDTSLSSFLPLYSPNSLSLLLLYSNTYYPEIFPFTRNFNCLLFPFFRFGIPRVSFWLRSS